MLELTEIEKSAIADQVLYFESNPGAPLSRGEVVEWLSGLEISWDRALQIPTELIAYAVETHKEASNGGR